MFPDSEIARTFACGKDKTAYIARFGLALLPPAEGMLISLRKELKEKLALWGHSSWQTQTHRGRDIKKKQVNCSKLRQSWRQRAKNWDQCSKNQMFRLMACSVHASCYCCVKERKRQVVRKWPYRMSGYGGRKGADKVLSLGLNLVPSCGTPVETLRGADVVPLSTIFTLLQ